MRVTGNASSALTLGGTGHIQLPAARLPDDRPFAVLDAGTGDLLGFRHIHPPSTIQRCAVQERESSAASHNNIRATSSGYSLRGRHWLRRIESSASGVTQ